jgi:hypothetical protein
VVRVNLPPGCAGIGDGDWKKKANRPGGFITLDESDPLEKRQLEKLRNQDYASAGLVDAGPEKFFTVKARAAGRWCRGCNTLYYAWKTECARCGLETIPEGEMVRKHPQGQYQP